MAVNLFAYGTLMTADGLKGVLGRRVHGLVFRPARLPGWRRVWNAYREEWQGGVLNVERAPSSSVLGVLVEGLTDADLGRLDAQEATHLPRETVMVEPRGGGPVLAQIYWLRQGNHKGGPSPRYQAVVLERARQVGPAVYENLRTASVDSAGEPLVLA